MKSKLPAYVIGLILVAIPFKIAFLSPSTSFAINIMSFISVLVGFLILLIWGSSNDHQTGH
jgi:hypothetical protein